MTTHKPTLKRAEAVVIFLAILGIVVAFVNIHKFASAKQPGSAVFAGVVIFVLSFVLATQLARMRKV